MTKSLEISCLQISKFFADFSIFIGVKKKTVRKASTLVINEVAQFWERAKVPIKPQHHAVKKLESLHDEYKRLKSNKNRKTNTQKSNEKQFSEKFNDLFDIAHAEALSKITIDEDRNFLMAQREKGRRGIMAGEDKTLSAREERTRGRLEAQKRRRKKADEEPGPSCVAILASSPSSCTSSDTDQPNDVVAEVVAEVSACGPPSAKRPRRAKKNIVTRSLAAALDRTKVSDRQAAFILTEAAKSLGANAEEYNINRSSIKLKRQIHREMFAQSVKDKFDPDIRLTVHWDGKLIPALSGKYNVDRLPVLVSGFGVSQLLAVPLLESGTGENQAAAVVDALHEWNIADRVVAMSFDTTSSNTGQFSGACTLIQQKLEKDLMFLACRHHIMELLVGAAFSACMETITSGPDVALFKRFAKKWSVMDQSSYQIADKMANFALIAPKKDDILTFAKQQLLEKQPRDDYRELLELSVIFLGDTPEGGVSFKCPGPMHHARWMSKVIYSFKVWMFSGQFKLTKKELHGLERFLVFIIKFYLKAWTTATEAVLAPASDLALLQQLTAFEEHDQEVAKAASKKLASHLWYLSEELVGLSLFDDSVPHDMKAKIVQKMGEEGLENPPKRAVVDLNDIQNKTLEDFASTNSLTLFNRMGLQTSFIETNPASWGDVEEFKNAKAIIKALKVVNDHAERGVALIQEYSGLLTKGEQQLQYLLQVTAEHRKMFPDSKKSTLSATRQQ